MKFTVTSAKTAAYAAALMMTAAATAAQFPAAESQPAQPTPRAVATVNGEPILDREVQSQLQAQVQGRSLPPEAIQQVRQQILDNLIETRLVEQYIREEGPDVDSENVDRTLARLEQQLQAQDVRLEDYLRSQGQTEEDLRRRVETSLAWQQFIAEQATDEKLREHFEEHKPRFDGTQVRARHILVQLPPSADDEARQAARAKLEQAREFLSEGGEFAHAASVYSDDAGTARQGGDLGYFDRQGQVVEPVAEAAFELEPGQVSQPVRSSLGVHLVQVVDRKEGDRDFSEARREIASALVADLWKEIVSERRPEAEIRVARPVEQPQRPAGGAPLNRQPPNSQPPNGAPPNRVPQ